MPTINSCCNITNQQNCVGADDFRPRILHKFIYIHFVGTSLAAVRYRQYPMQSFNRYNLPSTIASYYNQTFILPAFQHFLFIQKSKRLQKKSKLCPQKGKQASLKSKSFCAMLRKKRLKCGRIPARLFLACHQNPIFLSASSFAAQNRCVPAFLWAAPRDPTTPRRSIKFAASSAHSPVNSLPLKQYGLVRLASQAVPSPLKRAFKYCGAAIGSLIIKISRVANFYFAKVCSNKTYKL